MFHIVDIDGEGSPGYPPGIPPHCRLSRGNYSYRLLPTMAHFLGIFAVTVGLVSYVPYLWGMYQGKVRPHAFTWFLWGLLTAVAFAAQLSDGAGPGSWITGVTAVVSLGVAAAALHQSRFSNVARVDWYFFIAALVSIPLWLITNTPFTLCYW